ncbi:cytosolic carboxypeptidase 2 [Austrofundulus limnaeus]|uniref:Cytosolic carboxypeptidase 2 n=1 Tax=Austrofundulus limnaeus TaxID=52670 RepID=A0A2I4AZY5_AUSLI|nr:PREDICTED: cytosolic carboxypeptidase 2-like [Austrofundulus limnaeus]
MTEAVRTSSITSVIRNLLNTNLLDSSDTSDSNTEEEEDECAGREQLSINLSETLRTRQLLLNFHKGKPVLSLRAPLDLVKFPTSPCPRWPVECEVISDVIQHIEWEPPEPEPFYQLLGYEDAPKPVGEGKVVYCSDPATKYPYFTSSRVGGSRGPIKSTASCVSPSDFTLEFESRFESGNLQKAIQVGTYDYELTLRPDMYTAKHSHWFYFRVRNMKAGVTYRFTIVNLKKSSSLYSQGMRPLLYSERAAEENSVGWQRTGSKIKYYQNSCRNTKENDESATLSSLTWTLQFPHDSDTCYLAHCYPYTYSHLQRYLRRISSQPAATSFCKVRVLCQSLAGNSVYVLTVTSAGADRPHIRNKKAVVVTARVHPGETNGSWVMEGFLDFLLGDSDDAQVLRDHFIFKVVPMLNPDGVVVGNYRCSLAGRDLNRNYKTLLRDAFPCVWHVRNMVERLMAETEVVLYCDFHGHNRKNNVFMYGCNSRGDASLNLQERVFPLMMSKNASNKFSFRSCNFRVQKSKEGTGRVVMWRLGIRNSYTMEASFGGSTLDDRRGTHFTTRDLKSLGFHFCDTLLDFCDPDQTKVSHCLRELSSLLRKKVKERIGKDLSADHISVSDLETSTSGSDSSYSDGLPVHLQRQAHNPEKPFKKKKRRSKSHKKRNRLRRDRVRKTTQLKVLDISGEGLTRLNDPGESNLADDDSDKEIYQNKPVRERKKWKQIRKDKLSSPSKSPGQASQVTQWQGCKPIKQNSLENLSTSCQRHRTCLHPGSTHTAVAPQAHTGVFLETQLPKTIDKSEVVLGRQTFSTGGETKERRQWRCSSQLLHLSVFFPPPPNYLHSTQHRLHSAQWDSYGQICRGLPSPFVAPRRALPSAYASVVPAIVPTKRLPMTFTSTKPSSRRSFRNSSTIDSSEASSMLNTDVTKTKNREVFL